MTIKADLISDGLLPLRRSPLRPGRIFVSVVVLAGCAVFLDSLRVIIQTDLPPQWLVFAILTILGGTLTIKVPSLPAQLAVSEMFAFTCVLLFGPASGTLALALDGVCLSLRRRHRTEQMLFNAAGLGVSIWVASHFFFWLTGIAPLFQAATPMGVTIVPLALMTASFFLLNSGLMALAIGFDKGTPPLKLWREHFAWLAPNYFGSASISLLLVVALRQLSFSVIAVIPPLVLLSYLTVRSSLGRVEDADRHVAQVDRLYLSTVEALATAIDAKDEVTHDHVRRVQMAAVTLARMLGVCDQPTVKAIEAAALLHDTGKLAIPEHILNKPGKLTTEEFEVMKQHARIGAEILSSVDFPYPVVPIVRHHHENWDGKGYPDGLSGAEIPIGARILSVVDCFDALVSDRPYRKRMTDEAALAILRERSGTMYDPLVVETFTAAYQQIMPRDQESGGSPVVSRMGLVAVPAAQPEIHASTAGSSKHAEDMLALSSLSRAMSSQGSLSDTLALVWAHLHRMVPASMAAFYSVDPTGAATIRHTCGPAPVGLTGLTISAGHGVSGWVAANRRLMVNSEAALDLGDMALGSVPPLYSCLSAPLLVGETLVGVMTLYSDKPTAFDDEHGRLVQTVAPHIAESFQLALNRSSVGAVTPSETGQMDQPRQNLRLVSRR